MLKNKKIILSFFLLLAFIGWLILSFQSKNQTEDKQNESIQITTAIEKKYLQKISESEYTYYLPSDNLLRLTIKVPNVKKIAYILFDGNRLNLNKINEDKNEVSLSPSYELSPGKYNLDIIFADNTKKTFYFNIVYMYDIKNLINIKIKNSWLFNDEDNLSNHIDTIDGYILGGDSKKTNVIMDYEKNFENNVSFELYFTVKELNPVLNTVDLQLSFGERLFFNFDNHNIRIKRKEFIDKYKKLKEPKDTKTPYKKFRKNSSYKITFARNNNKYDLEIFEENSGKVVTSISYVDDDKNQIINEQYKTLRIGVGRNNMKILITKMVIK